MQHFSSTITVKFDEIVLENWPRRIYFILRCHVLTMLIILVGSAQLHIVVYRQQKIPFFKTATLLGCTHRLLIYTGLAFWTFLWLCYFRQVWLVYVWWIKVFVTFIMAWLSVPIMWLPLISSQVYEWYIAFGGTVFLMLLHTILAMFRKPFYNFTTEFFIKWTIRLFIFSSLGIVVSIAWKSSHIDVIVAVIMLTCQVILLIIFGRTMGCDSFYESDVDPNEYFYMILTHYNFISIFSHLVLALCKIRCVLAPHQYRSEPIRPPSNDTRNSSWVEYFGEVDSLEYTY